MLPQSNPESLDEKEIIWQDKLFLKDHVTSFFPHSIKHEAGDCQEHKED